MKFITCVDDNGPKRLQRVPKLKSLGGAGKGAKVKGMYNVLRRVAAVFSSPVSAKCLQESCLHAAMRFHKYVKGVAGKKCLHLHYSPTHAAKHGYSHAKRDDDMLIMLNQARTVGNTTAAFKLPLAVVVALGQRSDYDLLLHGFPGASCRDPHCISPSCMVLLPCPHMAQARKDPTRSFNMLLCPNCGSSHHAKAQPLCANCRKKAKAVDAGDPTTPEFWI